MSTIERCFFCQEKHEVSDHIIHLMDPCKMCRVYMKYGVIMIPIDPSKTDQLYRPYRTGRAIVLSDIRVKQIFKDKSILLSVLQRRYAFLSAQEWQQYKLP